MIAMTKDEKLRFVEGIMDIDEGSLEGDEELSGIGSWDSMSVLGFMTEMSIRFDQIIEIKRIKELATINDLCDLIPD